MKALTISSIVVGILAALSGVVFTMQGLGIVGPSTSFMYRNAQWIYGGSVALLVGIIIVIAGLLLGMRRRA